VRGVDLEVRAGEIVAVLGRNGSGKTSLLRMLAGAHQPSTGSVEATVPVAYVPQEPDSLLYSRRCAPRWRPPSLLGRATPPPSSAGSTPCDLHDLADRHPRTLSVGQRQRVAIAAVAVGDAPVLVLDEPTRGIDAASLDRPGAALRAHRDGGGAVVLATHDVELAARVATRVLVLGDGDVVADGPARHVLAGSLFAPQVLRVLPPFLTVDEVAAARPSGRGASRDRHRAAPHRSRTRTVVLVGRAGRRWSTCWCWWWDWPRSSTRSGSRPRPCPTRPTPATPPCGRPGGRPGRGRGDPGGAARHHERRHRRRARHARRARRAHEAAGPARRRAAACSSSSILAGAAFGPRFGLLLGLTSFVVSAVLSGGIGPWLPFQMLALGWMGAGAGLMGRLTRHLSPGARWGCSPLYGWVWGFVFGAIMNLWFWPFQRGGGDLSWEPGLSWAETLQPLLVVLRGHVVRVGRRRRARQRR
jgi:energy-coupling factor transporter ATP-binding protein EcfA2